MTDKVSLNENEHPLNNIVSLRNILFDTLRNLNSDKPMELERAKAINETAQTIINTAKVEVEAVKVVGASMDSKFIPMTPPPGLPPR